MAFLRAVNVGGSGRLDMAELRAVATEAGLHDVRSVLATGNLVFRSDERGGPRLESRLERTIARELGVPTSVLLRTPDALRAAIGRNPFPAAAASDPSHLLVGFLKRAPTPARRRALPARLAGPESIAVLGQEFYAVYPQGIGRSRLTLPRIEAAVGAIGTARNWTTVRRVAEIAEG